MSTRNNIQWFWFWFWFVVTYNCHPQSATDFVETGREGILISLLPFVYEYEWFCSYFLFNSTTRCGDICSSRRIINCFINRVLRSGRRYKQTNNGDHFNRHLRRLITIMLIQRCPSLSEGVPEASPSTSSYFSWSSWTLSTVKTNQISALWCVCNKFELAAILLVNTRVYRFDSCG